MEKEKVMRYLLEKISAGKKGIVADTTDAFPVSKSTVYNYLAELIKGGMIAETEESPCGYALVGSEQTFTYDNGGQLEEDILYRDDILPLFSNYSKETQNVWAYSFCEMMNNAIEHSGAERITVTVRTTALHTEMMISDNGVGIFKNIQAFLRETENKTVSLIDCAAYLLAGKFTTNTRRHSGEGIFFTSHALDEFAIFSDGVVFVRDRYDESTKADVPRGKGTTVFMKLSNDTKKRMVDVFERFSNVEKGFYRTHIPLLHLFPSGFPVSRSEARRLTAMLARFTEAVLDFRGIEDVGQAFVHEVFVVWAGENPDFKLTTENENSETKRSLARFQKA